MADILSIQTPYQDQDTVTSTNLNDLVKKATFTSSVVDGATTQLSSGAIIVRDSGITTNKILNGSVTEQKLDTATQNKLLQGPEISVPLSNGEAFVGGTKAGNARGTFSLDIQNKELTTPVDYVASGDSAVAYGFVNKAASDHSTAIGQLNIAGSLYSTAIGYSNNVSGTGGTKSAAIGYDNTANGDTAIALGTSNSVTASYSTAIGSSNTVSDTESHAFGRNISISSTYSAEMGIWSSSTTRKTAVKATYNGGVALTCENSASAPTDQATAGAEGIQELGRDMFTIQRDGDAFSLYFNDAGTIKSLSLGTVS